MKKEKMSLATKIMIALVIGVAFGLIANLALPKEFNDSLIKWVLNPVGNAFLRAIKLIVIPLVLFSLITGAASIGDIKKLGRVGVKIMGLYLFTTAFAITIGLIMANFIDPGLGMTIPTGAEFKATEPPFVMDIFVNMIPTNPFESLVKGDVLQVIVFAILFGIAMTMIGEPVKPLLKIIEQANEVFLKIIGIVMLVAPIGVFALISKVLMQQGPEILGSLFKYFITFFIAIVLHVVITYGGILALLGKVNPLKFFKKFYPAMIFAFSSASSSASIPLNLELCQEKLGVSEEVSSFTIPLGATVNMDGTAIMQGVAAIFIAQLFGIELGFQGQMMVILSATLASIGTAGVPGAGLVMLAMVLQQVGLPLEGIAIVLSVDRIIDMIRTSVNITGDAVCTIVVAKSEGEFNAEVYNS